MKTIEYRVRPVTRYIVTRFATRDHGGGLSSGGSEPLGEFDNESLALRAMEALARHEDNPLESPPMMADGKSIRWTE